MEGRGRGGGPDPQAAVKQGGSQLSVGGWAWESGGGELDRGLLEGW